MKILPKAASLLPGAIRGGTVKGLASDVFTPILSRKPDPAAVAAGGAKLASVMKDVITRALPGKAIKIK